jgi:hypothetical protein
MMRRTIGQATAGPATAKKIIAGRPFSSVDTAAERCTGPGSAGKGNGMGKHGKYMTEADAVAAGCCEAKTSSKK